MALTSVIPNSYKVPGTFLLVSLAVGPRSAGDAARKVLLFGNKTASGTATVAKTVAVFSEDDAKTLFGRGSELHLMCRAALLANPSVTLFAIPIAESAGASATGTLVYTGPATGPAGRRPRWRPDGA